MSYIIIVIGLVTRHRGRGVAHEREKRERREREEREEREKEREKREERERTNNMWGGNFLSTQIYSSRVTTKFFLCESNPETSQ